MVKNDLNQLDSTPNVNYLSSLRSSGYNNYSAIADIVDNSLDNDVNAANVKIYVKKTKDEYEYIKICDDGSGMNLETLKEAFKLGAITGKNKEFDLGSYGTGLKAAALSMGRKLTVKTKSEDDKFYIIDYDLDEMVTNNSFMIPIHYGSDEELVDFKKEINSETGTIIILSKLDRISNTNQTIFNDTLINKLGNTYKFFIDEMNKVISVNDKVVKSIDPMLRKESFSKCLTNNEKFIYKGKEFKFSVHNLEFVSKQISGDINRNSSNAGLYIYRNNRLVGSGLDLGIVGKQGDGYLNGCRIELFTAGDCDELFGSTVNKMIHEKDKNDLDQGFRDICYSNLKGYLFTIRNNELTKTKTNDVSDDVKDKLDRSTKGVNKNTMIDIIKLRGMNEHPETPTKKKETINVGRNTPHIRTRDDKFIDYRIVRLGEDGTIFRPVKEHGLYIVEINKDHPFCDKLIINGSEETTDVALKLLYSLAVSLQETEYYDNSEKEALLKEYYIKVSERLRKFIIY